MDEKEKALAEPFEAHEIEWRINRKGFSNGKPWATAIPYITSRAVQDRLDKVFGMFGWQNSTKMITGKGFLSTIKFKHNDEWIEKCDGAEGSTSNDMDLIKSGSSNSLKRAAVLLKVGRYLYELDEFFVDTQITDSWKHPYGNVYKDKKNNNLLVAWATPILPDWALPGHNVEQHIEAMKKAQTHHELELSYQLAKKASRLQSDNAMLEKANQAGAIKRKELNDKAAKNIAEDTKHISDWLHNQCNGLSLIPNETALKSLFKLILKDLKDKTKHTAVDYTLLINHLTEKYKERLDKLKKGNINEQ